MDDNMTVQSDRVIGTPSALAKSCFYYVQETGYLKSIRSHVSKREKMKSFLLVYVLSGEGVFTVRNKKIKAHKGAAFFVDCMEAYSHETEPDGSWELLWVHFNGSSSLEYYRYFTGLWDNVFYPEDVDEIIKTLRNLLDINKEKPEFYEAKSSELIVHLLTVIIETKKIGGMGGKGNKPIDDKLEQVRGYIINNYTEEFSLEEMEKRFYISKYYLCREFKKKYGESIIEFVRSTRITHAKSLLRFTSDSISEVGIKCGIADQSYFIKQFKSSEGITPSEFRKKWIG